MHEELYHPLGHFGGAEVGVQPTVEGQDIWIRLCWLLIPSTAV